MKLQDQCCTLEQAIRLKELGVVQQPALYYFYEEIINGDRQMKLLPLWIRDYSTDENSDSITGALDGTYNNQVYAAFTVAELGLILPHQFTSFKLADLHCVGEGMKFWIVESLGKPVCPVCENYDTEYHINTARPTEAQSRAAILIRLIEEGEVTSEQVNNHLSA